MGLTCGYMVYRCQIKILNVCSPQILCLHLPQDKDMMLAMNPHFLSHIQWGITSYSLTYDSCSSSVQATCWLWQGPTVTLKWCLSLPLAATKNLVKTLWVLQFFPWTRVPTVQPPNGCSQYVHQLPFASLLLLQGYKLLFPNSLKPRTWSLSWTLSTTQLWNVWIRPRVNWAEVGRSEVADPGLLANTSNCRELGSGGGAEEWTLTQQLPRWFGSVL